MHDCFSIVFRFGISRRFIETLANHFDQLNLQEFLLIKPDTLETQFLMKF